MLHGELEEIGVGRRWRDITLSEEAMKNKVSAKRTSGGEGGDGGEVLFVFPRIKNRCELGCQGQLVVLFQWTGTTNRASKNY